MNLSDSLKFIDLIYAVKGVGLMIGFLCVTILFCKIIDVLRNKP